MVVIAPALVQSASAIRSEKNRDKFRDDKLINYQAVLTKPEMQQITYEMMMMIALQESEGKRYSILKVKQMRDCESS